MYMANVGNLVGGPISGAILTASGGRYTYMITYAGLCMVIASFLILPVRFIVNRRLFVRT